MPVNLNMNMTVVCKILTLLLFNNLVISNGVQLADRSDVAQYRNRFKQSEIHAKSRIYDFVGSGQPQQEPQTSFLQQPSVSLKRQPSPLRSLLPASFDVNNPVDPFQRRFESTHFPPKSVQSRKQHHYHHYRHHHYRPAQIVELPGRPVNCYMKVTSDVPEGTIKLPIIGAFQTICVRIGDEITVYGNTFTERKRIVGIEPATGAGPDYSGYIVLDTALEEAHENSEEVMLTGLSTGDAAVAATAVAATGRSIAVTAAAARSSATSGTSASSAAATNSIGAASHAAAVNKSAPATPSKPSAPVRAAASTVSFSSPSAPAAAAPQPQSQAPLAGPLPASAVVSLPRSLNVMNAPDVCMAMACARLKVSDQLSKEQMQDFGNRTRNLAHFWSGHSCVGHECRSVMKGQDSGTLGNVYEMADALGSSFSQKKWQNLKGSLASYGIKACSTFRCEDYFDTGINAKSACEAMACTYRKMDQQMSALRRKQFLKNTKERLELSSKVKCTDSPSCQKTFFSDPAGTLGYVWTKISALQSDSIWVSNGGYDSKVLKLDSALQDYGAEKCVGRFCCGNC
eukprot:TRINITY_DN5489_c2_g1_i1.p1 TRINITY_DN5489_c2_g1~~TRINITY_DN5489_c2_g1_i1.p1  ORF type:complete len:570 (-),score=106.16 TRINITY_DN5489_c2_g1_i1:191-1900(-)